MATIKLRINGGGNPKVPVRQDFDIRDVLSGLVGSKNVLAPDDKAALYSSLKNAVGNDRATKLMNHAYIFNQRPELQNLSLDDRLRRFYDIGSSDPEISDILSKSKSLGYGVIPGVQTSPNVLNQRMAGRDLGVVTGTANPEIQRRIMLQTRK